MNALWYLIEKYCLPKLRQKIKEKDIQKAVQQWVKDGNMLYMLELRQFVDVKTEWPLDELSKRLKISKDMSAALLELLGYVKVANGNYRVSRSARSARLRKAWEQIEEGIIANSD